jgi:hypothetical protein
MKDPLQPVRESVVNSSLHVGPGDAKTKRNDNMNPYIMAGVCAGLAGISEIVHMERRNALVFGAIGLAYGFASYQEAHDKKDLSNKLTFITSTGTWFYSLPKAIRTQSPTFVGLAVASTVSTFIEVMNMLESNDHHYGSNSKK